MVKVRVKISLLSEVARLKPEIGSSIGAITDPVELCDNTSGITIPSEICNRAVSITFSLGTVVQACYCRFRLTTVDTPSRGSLARSISIRELW